MEQNAADDIYDAAHPGSKAPNRQPGHSTEPVPEYGLIR